MIFICNKCRKELKNLETEGKEICDDFFCLDCVTGIKLSLLDNTEKMVVIVNSTYHTR